MPTFRVTGGALTLDSAGSNYPSNELPGSQPGIDNSLPPGVPPIGVTLPEQPPQVWPPISISRPIVPIGPDNSLPVAPGTIWPPVGRPPHVDAGLPVPPSGTLPARPPVRPDQGLPGGGGHPDHGLPSKTYWMLAYAPSLGWKFIAIDPSLEVGHPLPPTAQPK